MRWTAMILLAGTLAFAGEGTPKSGAPATRKPAPRKIDFSSIDRKIAKKPQLNSPLYGLFLFGRNGEKRVWAILDKSDPKANLHDVLYLDRNADGDLTGPDERLTASKSSNARADQVEFLIPEFKDPGTGAVHTKFRITVSDKYIFYRMLWKGQKVTMGSYGPTSESYAYFTPTIQKAPIFLPGHDRPFEFEHWMSGTLQRGRATDFKVFVGNRGDRTGAFSSTDDKFLPPGEYVLATLIYRDANGKEQRVRSKLASRC